MKLTDEQLERISNTMDAVSDGVLWKDRPHIKALASGMRELAEIYANEMTTETSDIGDVVRGLMIAADDLEDK